MTNFTSVIRGTILRESFLGKGDVSGRRIGSGGSEQTGLEIPKDLGDEAL